MITYTVKKADWLGEDSDQIDNSGGFWDGQPIPRPSKIIDDRT